MDHAERKTGKTTYSFKKLLILGLEVMLSFSDKPLRLIVKLGILISFSSLIMALSTFIRYVSGQIELLGYASLIISIWLFAGVVIFLLGTVGLYISKTFEKVKGRPLFIITEEINTL